MKNLSYLIYFVFIFLMADGSELVVEALLFKPVLDLGRIVGSTSLHTGLIEPKYLEF